MYLYTAANTAGNVTAGVVIRLEVQGTSVRTFVDGTEVLPAQTTHGTFTDRQAMLQVLAPDSPSLGRTTSFDYFGAGSFVAPPSPPFWTRYQRCSETDS